MGKVGEDFEGVKKILYFFPGIQTRHSQRQAVQEALVIEHQLAASRINKMPAKPQTNKDKANSSKLQKPSAHIIQTSHKSLQDHHSNKYPNTSFNTHHVLSRINVKQGHKKVKQRKKINSHFRKLMLRKANDKFRKHSHQKSPRNKVSFKINLRLKEGKKQQLKHYRKLKRTVEKYDNNHLKYTQKHYYKVIKRNIVKSKRQKSSTHDNKGNGQSTRGRLVSRNFRNRNDELLTGNSY